MRRRPVLYIAGPKVFALNALAIGARKKAIVRKSGFEPLFPLDNEVRSTCSNPSNAIYCGNIAMVDRAEIIVANMNPFRSPTEPDSGTVWESAYAKGQGKIVIGHIRSGRPLVERLRRDPVFAQVLSRREDGSHQDGDGFLIEDFSQPLNLMICHGLTRLVVGDFQAAVAVARREFFSRQVLQHYGQTDGTRLLPVVNHPARKGGA